MKKSPLVKFLWFAFYLLALYLLYRTGFVYGLVGTLIIIAYTAYKRKIQIYAFLGKMRYAKGDMKNAIKWYGKAAFMPGAQPDTIVSYCYLLLKNGEIDQSEKLIDDLIARLAVSEEKKMLARSIKALIEWKRGRLDEAIAMLENVIENIETSNIYGSLGYLLVLKGDLDKALEFNLKAYDYNDNHDVILDNLGQTYYLREEYEKSNEIYQKLMSKNPKPSFPEAYYNYGLLLLAMGKKQEALDRMREALNYRISFLTTIDLDEIRKKIDDVEASG